MKDFGIFSHAISQIFIYIYLSGLFGTKLSIVKSKSTTSESAILYFVFFQVNSNFSRILALFILSTNSQKNHAGLPDYESQPK